MKYQFLIKITLVYSNFLKYIDIRSNFIICIYSEATSPQYRQMPVSYFRTYTYQPLAYQPQAIPQYQVSSRLVPSIPNSWQRQMQMSPAGQSLGPNSPSQPQYLSNLPPPNPHSQMGPNSETPIQQQPLSPTPTPAPQHQTSEYNLQPSSMMNTPYSAAPQLMARPIQQYPNSMSLEYMSNVPSMNMQQLQFVPCMCPVSVTISAQPVPIEKRSDEVTSDSMDSISIIAPPEEKI